MKTLTAALCCLGLAGACSSPQPAARSVFPVVAASDQAAFACLREAIYYEAGARSPEGQQAVANVIMNRARDPRFPGTICGVIAEGEASGRCQFSYRCDGAAESFGDAVKFRTADRAARIALGNPDRDVTKGAVFFHAASMAPGWFGTLERTVSLGGNIFYRG